ncbi:MAG: hypothetical protein WDO73_12205 [Ignavibacteriota bacterium]
MQNLFQLRNTPSGPYYVAASALGSDGRAVAPDGTAAFKRSGFHRTGSRHHRHHAEGDARRSQRLGLRLQVSKDIQIAESKSVQIRMDSTNFFNAFDLVRS